MKLILGTNKYSGKPLEIIQSVLPGQFEYKMLEEQTEECFIRSVGEADYILAGGRTKITKAVLDKAKNLKMIQRSGVGLDSLDMDAIREKGIPLYVNQGINAQSVAEHTLLLMLASLRRLPVIDRNTKNGIWKKQEQGVRTAELRGKTIGIIGMGNIAKKLVSLLKPFGVQIVYNNLMKEPEAFERENNMRFAGVEELLQASDIVTLHCALTDATRGLINAESVQKMKQGAVLINTARGPMVDPQAVAAALLSGKLSFAGLDVHEKEPLPEGYPLKDVDNVILTPHIAGVTYDSFRAMMEAAFHNIDCFEKGETAEIETFKYL